MRIVQDFVQLRVTMLERSGPTSRDIMIPSLRDPILRDTFSQRSTLPQNCAIPWCLVSHMHICAIPHVATYRPIIMRYPIKTSTKSFAILSLQVRYESIFARPLSVGVYLQFLEGSANLKFPYTKCRRYLTDDLLQEYQGAHVPRLEYDREHLHNK